MSADVIVIGGGFTGLSAATAVAERKLRVKLYEARPYLGGSLAAGDLAIHPAAGEGVRRLLARLGLDRPSAEEGSCPAVPSPALLSGATAYVEGRRGQVRTAAPARILLDGGLRVFAKDKEHRVRAVLSTVSWHTLGALFAEPDACTRLLARASNTADGTGVVHVVPGLFLAGDWIDTGRPATIERAVADGESAADAVIVSLRP